MASPRGELPPWVDVGADPAAQSSVALAHCRPCRFHHRRKSARSHVDHAEGRRGFAQGLGLSSLLRHQLYLHRPCRGRCFSCRTLQYRRRRPGLFCRPRCRHGGLYLEFLPWPIVIPLAILASHAVWRLLGLHSGLPAGQARQPHRHHHHHVQLHRRQPDGLSHQQLCSGPWARWRWKAARSPAPIS